MNCLVLLFAFSAILNSGLAAISCSYTKECPGDEVCIRGACQCPDGQITYQDTCVFKNEKCSDAGQIPIDGICFKTAWVHQRCLHNEQCLGTAVCQNGFCECPQGSTQDGKRCVLTTHCGLGKVLVKGTCYETAGIYENCTFDDQCLGGSVCVNETCRCPKGPCYGNGAECAYCDWSDVEVKGECYASVNMDEECQLSEQCPYGAECIKGFCKCPSGTRFDTHGCYKESGTDCKDKQIFIRNREGGQCFDRVHIGEKCQHSEQCLGDANCVAKICKCPEGTKVVGERCVRQPRCKSYEVAADGKCWDKVSIGSACTHDNQCIAKATCIRMDSDFTATCQCESNTQYNGAECRNKPMIRCPYDWLSVNDTICLPQEPIGNRCLDTAQCKGFSRCIQGVCNCAPGYKEIRKTCRSTNEI